MSEIPPDTTVSSPPPTAVTPTVTSTTNARPRSYKLVAFLLAAQIPILLLSGYLSRRPITLTSLWALNAVAMLALLMALGDAKGRIGGVLINEHNLMSVSRFQLVAWTLLICSAFSTIALARVFNGVDDALAIKLPMELWQLLGISGASSVGSALIQQNKKNKQPAAGEMERAAASLQESAPAVASNAQGVAYSNAAPEHAHFTDMFEGDEIANSAYIDMSKVQMYFFTLIALITYGAQLAMMMNEKSPSALGEFPAFSSGLLALLGISHATYLGSKSVDKTKTT